MTVISKRLGDQVTVPVVRFIVVRLDLGGRPPRRIRDDPSRCPFVQFPYLVRAFLNLGGIRRRYLRPVSCFRVQLPCLLHNGASNRTSDIKIILTRTGAVYN